MKTLALAAALAVFAPIAASAATAADTLKPQIAAFASVKSFVGDEIFTGSHPMTNHIEYVAPDRWHLHMDSGKMESIMVGDAMYVKMGGSWMHMPMMGMGRIVDGLKSLPAMLENGKAIEVADKGADTVDGEPCHEYELTDTAHGNTVSDVWFSTKDNLPRKAVTGNVTVLYHDFNTPITIAAP